MNGFDINTSSLVKSWRLKIRPRYTASCSADLYARKVLAGIRRSHFLGNQHRHLVLVMIAHSKPSILLHLTQFRWRTILSTVIRYYLKHRRRYLTLLLPLLIILSLRKSKKAIRGPASNLKSSNVKECKVADRGTSLNNNGVVDIDWNFFKELKYLFRVIFPTWRTKEIRLLVMQSLLLLLRTFLSLYVATLDGKIVSSLVQGRGRLFLISILWWMIVAIPATFTNSMVRR